MLDEFPSLSARAGVNELGCYDVVRCIFNLTDTDIQVLKVLSEDRTETAASVGRMIEKDRSTAHRSLEKLVSCGLCIKERKGNKPRGFSNVYRRIGKRQLYSKTKDNLDHCYNKINRILEDLN